MGIRVSENVSNKKKRPIVLHSLINSHSCCESLFTSRLSLSWWLSVLFHNLSSTNANFVWYQNTMRNTVVEKDIVWLLNTAICMITRFCFLIDGMCTRWYGYAIPYNYGVLLNWGLIWYSFIVQSSYHIKYILKSQHSNMLGLGGKVCLPTIKSMPHLSTTYIESVPRQIFPGLLRNTPVRHINIPIVQNKYRHIQIDPHDAVSLKNYRQSIMETFRMETI